ncbi:MAG: hypothetical protein GC154_07605 [bacterium]|nr:hypothetical protein [bacterium]
MMSRIFTACFALLIFTLGVFAAGDGSSAGRADLLRDQWGVPHVFAETDEAAMYGLGWACAEDRAFQMYFNLRTIQGRLAELLGDEGSRKYSAPEFDEKMRIMGFYRAAQKAAENLSEDDLALLKAYSRGVNDYIKAHRGELLDLFEQYELDPEPWTPADCIASWWNLARFFAGEGLHDSMVYNQRKNRDRLQPAARGRGGLSAEQMKALLERAEKAGRVVDDSAAVVQRGDVSDEWIEQVHDFLAEHGFAEDAVEEEETPKFSHAWAVGKKKMSEGTAALVSDPQTPVRVPSLLYEFHVKGATFNARGVGVPGSPVILIGWNEHVAWGMTALGADQADQFKLKMDDDHPDQYWFDGEWHDMTVWNETIKVRGGRDITITLRETRFGPVVDAIANGLEPGDHFALKRVPACEPERETFPAALAMMRSHDIESFYDALSGWRFPSANVVFADSAGKVGYSVACAVPLRSPLAIDGGAAAHDGTESKYDWRGYVPFNLLPHVLDPDRGYAFSGNHRPIASFYPAPMGLGTGSGGDTTRSWRLRQRIEDAGLLTPEKVREIHYDTVNPARKALAEVGVHLLSVSPARLSDDSIFALGELSDWLKAGARSEWDCPGAALAENINTMFRILQTTLAAQYGGGETGLTHFLKSMEKKIASDPKADLGGEVAEYIDQVVSNAWRRTVAQYGEDPAQWNQAAAAQVQKRSLEYMDTLDGFGSLDRGRNLPVPALRDLDGGTIFSQMSQSYTQWVPLDEVDSARSLLPVGDTEHTASPYYTATLSMWQSGETHPAPLSRAAVEPYVKERTALLP